MLPRYYISSDIFSMLKFLRTQWRATRRNGAKFLLLYVCDDFALDRAIDF